MPTIEIQALDTLFFRDGKPFEMGDDNWAEGIFPPPPSVFYGALRSAYFAEHPEELDKMGEDNDPTKDLEITGIYLMRDGDILLPSPLDLVLDKNYDNETLFHLRIVDNSLNEIKSNYKFKYITYFEGEVQSSDSYFVQENTINRIYFPNKFEEKIISKYSIDKLIKKEAKIGIGLNNISGNVEEGKLYRVGLNRLTEEFDNELNEYRRLKFIVEYEKLDISQNGIFKLGAENKVSQYIKVNKTLSLNNYNSDETEYLKIITLTPTLTTKNEIPDLQNLFSGIDITVLTTFIGKNIRIGGWDIANREPKKMYKTLPAGSVFYIKINNGKYPISEIRKKINKNSISELRQKEGFGLFYIAHLKFNDLKINL